MTGCQDFVCFTPTERDQIIRAGKLCRACLGTGELVTDPRRSTNDPDQERERCTYCDGTGQGI